MNVSTYLREIERESKIEATISLRRRRRKSEEVVIKCGNNAMRKTS